jgi:hypothetical protein
VSIDVRVGDGFGNSRRQSRAGVKNFPEDKREVWLDRKKVQNLATALDEYPEQGAADALRPVIVTGARPGEVPGAEPPELGQVVALRRPAGCIIATNHGPRETRHSLIWVLTTIWVVTTYAGVILLTRCLFLQQDK